MPNFPIEARSVEDAIAQWKLHKTPFWSLWSGSTLKCINDKDDDVEAEELLQEQLEGLNAIGYDGVVTIRTYTDNKKVNSKSGYKGSFNVQLHEKLMMTGRYDGVGGQNPVIVVPGQRQPQNDMQNKFLELLQGISDTQTKLNDRLLALEQQEDDEDEEQEDEEDEEEDPHERIQKTIGMITTFVEPYKPYLEQLFQRLIGTPPPAQNNQFSPQNIGEVAEKKPMPQNTEEANQRLAAALQVLEQKIGGNELVIALEALAAKNAIQLKGLLAML